MAPATQGAPNQPPRPGGDPPQPSSKRPLPAAEAAEINRNPKRQKLDHRSEPVNLDHIIILATGPKGTGMRSSLNKFGSRDFPNQLRPHHYDYEALRDWLWRDVGIDRSTPLGFVHAGKKGEKTHAIVADDNQFNAALVSVTNGSYALLKGDMGPFFGLCPMTTDKSATESPQPEVVKSQQGGASDGLEPMPPQPAAAANVANSAAPATEAPATVSPQPPAMGNDDSGQGDVAEPVHAQPTAAATVTDSAGPAPKLPPQQTPVYKQAIVDMVNLISDSDDDDQPKDKDGSQEDPAGTHGPQPKIREPRLDDFDESMFQRALQFFQTAEQPDGKCQILGQRITFHWYQVYRVFRMFMSPAETGVNGVMIDWDTGFGKTLLAWLYLYTRARLASRWEEANGEWEDPPRRADRKHLPVRCGQAKGARCPIQHKSLVVCPCVEGSDSRVICETYLSNTPALVVMPPALAKTWLGDLKKGLPKDQTTGKPKLLNVYTYISKMKDENNLAPSSSAQKNAKRQEIINNTAGQEADNDEVQDAGFDDDFDHLIKEGNGTAKDVFLVSNSTVGRLVDLYPKLLGADKKPTASYFTFGVVFMDEFHKYKGNTAAFDTIPFTMVRNVSSKACHPVGLYPMSGTTIDGGPPAWRATVDHLIQQCMAHSRRLTRRAGLTPEKTLGQYHNIRKKYNQLLRDLSTDAISDVDAKAAAKDIRAFLSVFVTTLRQGQIYRGRAVNKLPAITEQLVNVQPQMDDHTQAALQGLITQVNTLMGKRLKQAISQWKEKKLKAEEQGELFAESEPTSQSIMAGLVSNEIKIGSDKTNAFLHLQRSSMYPHLAALLTDGDDKCPAEVFAKATRSKESQEAAMACQQLLLQEGSKVRKEALEKFSNWEFATHRQQIVGNSVKYKAIKGLIREMVADNNPNTRPPDKSGKRQAIIFCSQNISAAITYYSILTDPQLKDVVEPLLVCSDIDPQERQEIIDYFNKDSSPERRNKVLIGVLSVTAEGYNIQRANNVWFAELPTTFTKQQQAIGRAHRQRQQMEVAVVKLQEEGNLMEEYGYQLMAARKKLQRLICDVQMA